MDDISAGTTAPAKPQGVWGTILTTTPIVLTVLATAFAGLSSSEMTRSMYYRSLAAQQQSKAGDQWAFFQAKRIRGTNLEMTVELLQSLTHPAPFNPLQVDVVSLEMLQRLDQAAAKTASGRQESGAAEATDMVKKRAEKLARLLAGAEAKDNLAYLTAATLPKVETRSLQKPDIRETIEAVVQAIGQRKTEEQTADQVRTLSPQDIEDATQVAEQNADAFDRACEPVTSTIKQMGSLLGELVAAARPLAKASSTGAGNNGQVAETVAWADGLNNSFRSAALEFDARRYRQEAFYNRKAAELYEVRVRRSGLESDRHRERSNKFFYSMLVAQAGVTIASLALAKAQRNVLWLLAAAAGLAALAFSGYAYLSP